MKPTLLIIIDNLKRGGADMNILLALIIQHPFFFCSQLLYITISGNQLAVGKSNISHCVCAIKHFYFNNKINCFA